MGLTIKDGTGSNVEAAVTSENQLKVIAESRPSVSVQAEDGNTFIIHYECETAAAASGGFMTITNNESRYNVEVTTIFVDSHTITPSDLIVTQVFDADISNGTDVSSTAVVQKNRSLSRELDLTVIVSDSSSDMTYTGGEQYHAFPIPTMTSTLRDVDGTNILNTNSSLTFGWKTRSGSNATDGEVVSFSINVIRRLK